MGGLAGQPVHKCIGRQKVCICLHVADQVRHTCDNCYKSHSTNLRTQFAKCVNKSHSTQPADTIATICGKPTLATTVRRMLRTRCDTRATHVRPPCGTHWCHFHFFDHWALRNTPSFDCCKKNLVRNKITAMPIVCGFRPLHTCGFRGPILGRTLWLLHVFN